MDPARIPAAVILRACAAPVVAVLACALLVHAWLGISYAPLALMLDTVFLLPVSAGIALGGRWRWQPWSACACLALLLVAGSAWKLAMLGSPLVPLDVVEGLALLQVLPGWRLALAIGLLATWTLVLLLSLWPASLRRSAWLAVPACWIALLLLLPAPFARALQAFDGGTRSNDAARLLAQGGIAHLVRAQHEGVRELSGAPGRDEVAGALHALGISPVAGGASGFDHRPVHVVLLESVWDATRLDDYSFSADPFDPAFRKAWEAGGRSTVMVPSFGGATANAEFEFLCAMPALRSAVVFEVGLELPVPCLPRVLRGAGYETVAIHPHLARYWNRDEAYPLLGFESYRPITAFKRDDMDGAFLSDDSTFRQVREWSLGEPAARPRFTWLVTLGSHYPYDRDRAMRPDQLRVTPHVPLLEAYANATRHTTAAFMRYARSVLEHEPDALIVAFGDHAPVLGTNPDPYGERSKEDGSLYAQLSSTPLLVLDGRNGPRAMGSLPLHRLAPRLLSLLGAGHPVLPQAPMAGGDADAQLRTRLFFNHLLWRGNDGRWRPCGDTPGCDLAAPARRQLEVVRDDLIRGEQHALRLLDANRYARPIDMRVVADYPACVLEVEGWGPFEAIEGDGFNVQPDGSNAFWLGLVRARGRPRLHVAGFDAPITIAGDMGSASIDSLPPAGTYPLTWHCADGNSGSIGVFTVRPAG